MGSEFVESLGAVVPILTTGSRAERATVRAAREMARRQAEQGRLAHLALNDGLAVTGAEIERLTACHLSEYRRVDWHALAGREAITLPVRTQEGEKAARRALATWKPSWQERMFGDESQRRRQLAAKVFDAAREDEVAFQRATRAAQTHNAESLTARRLFELDPRALKEAVVSKSRLPQVRDGMNSLGLALPGAGRLVAVAEAIQDADVAHERITDGDPRSARREPITASERRRIHLATVCAVALRVGAELVSVLPLESVEVVVACEAPDPAGGRPAPQPILQLLMTAKMLAELDWKKGDAISLATSIGARMDWSIEKGFAPIRLVALSAAGRPLAATA
jgi:hypothetical protein